VCGRGWVRSFWQTSLAGAEQPSRRSSGALLHLEFYAAETFHQIEELVVDLDRIDRRPALLPRPTRLGVGYTPFLSCRTSSHLAGPSGRQAGAVAVIGMDDTLA
jgi:hypothetical protein